ncbi:MAG: ATP-binding cassette domain-containing protein [Candidatus Neomarinimicrobiota bacterium]
MAIIAARGLTKHFDELVAVNQVSFEVAKGEIFGFLGPNGAGKSTTINMLATLLTPTAGEAEINGYPILTARNEVRRSIGLVFQDPSLDERLTAEENLRFHARLYRVSPADYQRRVHEVLLLVDLLERRDSLVKTFSGGMKRRLEIARGLIHYPAVLFLDEPTLGLDPQTRAHLWDYILKLKHDKGITIFMTTHYMHEAEFCDRIAIIDHGEVVALDTPAGLKSMMGGDIVRLVSRERDRLREELVQHYQRDVKESNGALQLEVQNGETFLPQLFRDVTAPIDAVELRKPTLEDVFLQLTGRTIREEEASGKDRLRQRMRKRRRT